MKILVILQIVTGVLLIKFYIKIKQNIVVGNTLDNFTKINIHLRPLGDKKASKLSKMSTFQPEFLRYPWSNINGSLFYYRTPLTLSKKINCLIKSDLNPSAQQWKK